MARNDERLISGVALVTGAGGGLGRELARALSARGLRVAALGRDENALAQTADNEGRITPILADVSDFNSLRSAFTAADRLGPLTLLINNAATYPRRDILDESPESFMATVNTNLGGTLAASRLALDRMVETGFGRILNVATFADLHPLPASSAYSVSKGAARILTRALVADLADRFPDIVMSDWMPGMLATRMGIPDGLDPAQSAQWGVELALWHDRTLTGTTFEQAQEIPPPRGLKSRLKDRLWGRRVTPRRLD
ncbi:SDR family oxidoreductase [Marimonas lutisalis]|uniref:SDR family oxidoreductase n=1 Tax=Marimonas lutisalis TaxID=2545756 RepID=UPI0010F4624B|nr:SDR family oxidoreductase [Marimonas lutisalis]